MAKVLFVSLVFPPDAVSTAQIIGQLAGDLRARGHSVTVVTTTPHYNRDMEAESIQPLRNYWGVFLQKSEYKGVPVFHTIMPRKGSNVFLRLLAWAGFHLFGTLVGLTVVPKPDLIFCPSPPLTIGLSAWMIGKIRKAPFIYNVQEIYPDIAIRLGALKNKRIIKILYAMERFIYNRAEKVTVIAPKMRANLLGKGVSEAKVLTIPNFVDINDLSPLEKDNAFSRKYNLFDKFVVSYAGNMGVPQGLNTFIDAAVLLQKRPGIIFLMMGDGMQRGALLNRVRKLHLKNIVFLPHQPFSLIPEVYASSDANLVPQAAETGFEAVPSKIYRIMACARPVIAITEESSDLARLVIESGCGVVVPPSSSEKLVQAILFAYQNPQEWIKRGESGRSFVVRHYSRDTITGEYHNLIRSVLSL